MLEVRILGTAAGGGFPQWNCACPNCRLARDGSLTSRLQSGAAISTDGHSWHLLNASPDVARQLESLRRPKLTTEITRSQPVADVFVTNADLDHALGLFQLREGSQFSITASGPVRDSLERGLRLSAVLDHYGRVSWREAAFEWTRVADSGLEAKAIELRGTKPPRYDRDSAPGTHAIGWMFRAGGAAIGFFPDVAVLDDELLAALAECERVWFDGTFWSETEMVEFNGRTAAQMGHVPIEESLPGLRTLGPGRVTYLHINNTNPVLRPDSRERAAVIEAGLAIAEDGDHFVC